MLKKFVFLLFPLFLLAASATRADDAVNAVEKIRSRYAQTPAFDASFRQTLTHRESGAEEKREGRLRFQKPLKISWITKPPHEETLIVTDSSVWDYFPDEKIAYKYAPEIVRDSRGLIQVLTGQAALNRDFEVKYEGRENGLVKLLLYPNEPTAQLTEARIWAEPDSGFIRRVRVIDFYGNSNDVALGEINPRDSIPPSAFKFSPPKGVETEDRTRDGSRELFK